MKASPVLKVTFTGRPSQLALRDLPKFVDTVLHCREVVAELPIKDSVVDGQSCFDELLRSTAVYEVTERGAEFRREQKKCQTWARRP